MGPFRNFCERLALLLLSAATYEHQGCPDARMIPAIASCDERRDGAAKRLGAADLGIVLHCSYGTGGDIDGGVRIHLPMRNEKRARACIKKGTGKARKCFGAIARSRRRVASRHDHPIGVEL